jgi:hypothetical protein
MVGSLDLPDRKRAVEDHEIQRAVGKIRDSVGGCLVAHRFRFNTGLRFEQFGGQKPGRVGVAGLVARLRFQQCYQFGDGVRRRLCADR